MAPHLLPLGTTLEGLEKKGDNSGLLPSGFWTSCGRLREGYGGELQKVEVGKWPEVAIIQVTGERMSAQYSRIRAIGILQTQGAGAARGALPRRFLPG